MSNKPKIKKRKRPTQTEMKKYISALQRMDKDAQTCINFLVNAGDDYFSHSETMKAWSDLIVNLHSEPVCTETWQMLWRTSPDEDLLKKVQDENHYHNPK